VWKWWTLIWIIVAGAAPGNLAVAAEQATEGYDSALRRAEAFVDRSDRYLHQSKLRRGMSGYGLTVMAGTKIEKFQATVVSILGNFSGPRRDVVLCKLSGLGLAESGIITGMSGSPVFIQDPADGKHKMIGAVAYAWSFQKDPICGVQPIAQMLALEGVPLPGAGKAAAGIAAARPKAGIDEDLARTLLRPAKIDFSTAALPRRFRPVADARPGTPRLLALSTPVMVAGAGRRAMALAEKVFSGTTLAPIRTGTVASAEARAAADAKLQPGMAISVPLVSGDADWAAVGTVTEVIGDYVLALGHSFYAEGPVELPMGPAYVHTVVPSAYRSFKLGSTLRVTGALTQDEYTAVAGRVGQTARMVPMTVTVHWAGSRQNFQ
jgi:hypothetical protein